MRSVRFLLLSLLLLPFSAFAEYYYWRTPIDEVHYKSAQAAFSALEADARRKVNPDQDLNIYGHRFLTPTMYGANFQYCWKGGSCTWDEFLLVNRHGSGCPADHTYNSTTGECEPEEPKDCPVGVYAYRTVQIGIFGHDLEFISGPVTTPDVCSGGCRYNFHGWEPESWSTPPNEPGKPIMQQMVYFSYGDECTGSEGDPDYKGPTDPGPPPPDTTPPDQSCPAGYVMNEVTGLCTRIPPDPTGCPPGFTQGPNTDTCFKDPDPKDPGDGDGDGGGDGPGDGDGDGGGSGPGDGGGSGPGDGGGSGPGDGGGSGPGGGGGSGPGGGGSGPGGGGGTGPGDGDGDGEEEGEGEYKPGQGDSVCESKPECSGDPIQCGIVDQQWRARCDAEKAGDFPGQKDAIGEAVTGPQFGLLEAEGDIEVPSFIEGHARWLPGNTCPPDERMSLRLAGGRTFSLSYQPLCTAATTISPLLVVIATVLAGLYIGRASGD